MTITEGLMTWGDYSIPLKPNTPRSIVQLLNTGWFGLIRVYASRVQSAQVGTATGLFTGVMLDRPDRFTIGGAGGAWFLGEATDGTGDSEVGPVTTNTIFFDGSTNGSLTDWVTTTLFTTDSGIAWGYIGGPASSTKYAGTFVRRTPKTILDAWIVPRFGVEYRMNPDLTLDTGYPTQLFPFAAPYPMAVKKGGRDLDVVGLQASQLSLEQSVRDRASRAITVISDPATYQIAVAAGWAFSAPDGTPLQRTFQKGGTSSSQATVPLANGEALADAQKTIADLNVTTRSIKISSTEYDITSRVTPGDYIYVYDVDEGLFDQTNQVMYRGKMTYPVLLRVTEITWPLRPGMSVHFDNRHQGTGLDVTDLTRYIDFEQEAGDVTITVGAPPKTLGRVVRRK